MKLVCLPVEIYQREFDSKLILAYYLSLEGFTVLIGYDKHFNNLLQYLPSTVLVDKSCSPLITRGRIRPTKKNGGMVLVNDEEGFVNIKNFRRKHFSSRIDRSAPELVDTYACWGEQDYRFYSENVPTLKPILKKLGNPRSLLLGDIGLNYYSREIDGLKKVFGNYILCSDNFGVERRVKNYRHPSFGLGKEVDDENQRIFELILKVHRHRRDIFTNLLRNSIKEFQANQFILRPHPVSDPRWWQNELWEFRNTHILSHLSIEPWIHGSSMLIAMGCTSCLQSAVANKPYIEIADHSQDFIHDGVKVDMTSSVSQFTPHIVNSHSELSSSIAKILLDDSSTSQNRLVLNKIWHNSQDEKTFLSEYSGEIMSLSDKILPKSSSASVSHVLRSYALHLKSNPLSIDAEKWPNPSLGQVIDKIKHSSRFINVKNISRDVRISEVSDCLYLFSP